MFDRFTSTVKQAIDIAYKAAEDTNGTVGTEHILFGLLSVPDSVASKVLKPYGITNSTVERYFEKGVFTIRIGGVGLTPRAKRVLQLASIIAGELHHAYVGTEHILIALVDDEDSLASRILEANGVNLNKIKESFLQEFSKDLNPNIKIEFKSEGNLGNDGINMGMNMNQGSNSKGNLKELEKLGVDLTEKAKMGKLDPVIGREKEIERIIQVLCRRTKNNPVLIGEPGVGKSAIADGLAQAIVANKVPELLKNKIVFSLDMASVVAGTKYRGEFEERFKNALNTIKSNGNIILFIDEIHTIVNAGASEGALDAANILKPMLARGEIQTIGATTFDEYRKYIEKDAALERRFQSVTVDPPSVDDTILILQGLRDKYEAHHKVVITDEAIIAAAKMSDRYISDRFLPDKAIDLIDEAASKKRIDSFIAPDNVKDLEKKIDQLKIELDEAITKENFDKAGKIKKDKDALIKKLEDQKHNWKEKRSDKDLSIGKEEVADVVSSWTSIPVSKLTEDQSKKLLELEDLLKKRVIGQDEAVSAVARAIKRARAGLQDPNRPIGSFIFLGPTGVGKTELSKALAEVMFGDEDLMIRVDMSEYMDKANVSKLIGSAPGYVGFDEGGQLTEKVRRHPYSVILFDEIEKAHPDVFNILLQVLEDGRITDSHGRTINFKNTIIIMTSNIGATDIANMNTLGFGGVESIIESDYEHMKEKQMQALKKAMKPEFVNRIDEIIIFRKLQKEQLSSIANIMINRLQKRLVEKDIKIAISDSAKNYIVDNGTDVEYGARPLRRTLQKLVEDRLSEEILSGNVNLGDEVKIDLNDNKLSFNKIK